MLSYFLSVSAPLRFPLCFTNANMQLWLIPILPLAGFLINGIFGRRFSKGLVNVFAIGSVVLAFAWVLKTLLGLGDLNQTYSENYFTWIQSGAFRVDVAMSVDRLTALMLLIVTGIGSLIHIYTPPAIWPMNTARDSADTTASSPT